ncbi:unnamed protein product, partial [Tetraodon nigroviridis]
AHLGVGSSAPKCCRFKRVCGWSWNGRAASPHPHSVPAHSRDRPCAHMATQQRGRGLCLQNRCGLSDGSDRGATEKLRVTVNAGITWQPYVI